MAKNQTLIVPKAVQDLLTPQAFRILKHLGRTGSITQREALLDLSVQSLTRRITELRSFYEITSVTRYNRSTGQRYMRYYLGNLRKTYLMEAAEV